MFSFSSRRGKVKVFNPKIYKNNNKIPKKSRERRIKTKPKLSDLEFIELIQDLLKINTIK